ncbi:Protein of unknown function [Pyronema omphalodes CBS 100304]|uniref:Uncharacterized protein n=1 Tax=Pyronema omphalodes (strain CBS 100304) TaxID=1076935 RepID=U4KXL1_PYROM|nr:Protein of unknown function [Pyronema omphalodes CBS 100304]
MSVPPPKPKRSFRNFFKKLTEPKNQAQKANKQSSTGVSGASTNPPGTHQYEPPASYGQYLAAGGVHAPTNLRDPNPSDGYVYYAEPENLST